VSGGGITTTDTNKTALAVMMVLLLTMALGVFSNALYSPENAAKPGYNLPEGGEKTVTAEAPKEPPLPNLLAKADLKKGQADVHVCESCHNLEKGAGAKVGPPLYGVVGRPKGSIAGFAYSDGMKGKGGDWTYDDLNKFLTKPSAYVSGTKMTYPGEPDAQKRADIIDYLHTLADSPLPLPKEEAAPAPAAKGAATEAKPAPAPAPAEKVAPPAPAKK
jgi:cytochrome c